MVGVAEATVQTIETPDGGRIAFRDTGGAGDAALLVPSLGRAGTDFEDLVSRLVDAGYRTVAVDQRGSGESEGPVDGITLHTLSADLAAVVEMLGIAPVHAIGHAFGNRVVRCLATDRRELVRSVSLLAAGGKIEPDEAVRRAGARCMQPDRSDAERIAALEVAFFAPGNDASVWLDGWWPGGALIQQRANLATPVDDWWEAGSAPILVAQGLNDTTAPPANGHALKEQLGDRVELVDITNAGHALLPEQPEAVARAVLGFLARH